MFPKDQIDDLLAKMKVKNAEIYICREPRVEKKHPVVSEMQ